MASEVRFVLRRVGYEVFLRAEAGELEVVRERRKATPYFTSKSAKAQVRRLVGTEMEPLLWTVEPYCP